MTQLAVVISVFFLCMCDLILFVAMFLQLTEEEVETWDKSYVCAHVHNHFGAALVDFLQRSVGKVHA